MLIYGGSDCHVRDPCLSGLCFWCVFQLVLCSKGEWLLSKCGYV